MEGKLNGRKRRSMYVAISREVHLAAKQRALADQRTLSLVVEDALRTFLGLGGAREEEKAS